MSNLGKSSSGGGGPPKLERQGTTLRPFATWGKKLRPEEDDDDGAMGMAPSQKVEVAPKPSAAVRASLMLQMHPGDISQNPSGSNIAGQVGRASPAPQTDSNNNNNNSGSNIAVNTAASPSPLSASARPITPQPKPLMREETTIRAFDVWKKKLTPDKEKTQDLTASAGGHISRSHTPAAGGDLGNSQQQNANSTSSLHNETRIPIAEPAPPPPTPLGRKPHRPFFEPEKHDGWKRTVLICLSYFLLVNGTMSKWAHFIGRKYSETKLLNGWRAYFWYIFLWSVIFLDAAMRGAGQTVLANNPISGIFVCGAALWYSRWQFVLAMTGLLMATLTAFVMGVNRGPIRSGLFGYPGFLLGSGAALLIDDTWNYKIFLLVGFLGCVCTIMNVTLGNWLVPKFRLPPLTTSFVICTMTLLGCVKTSTNLATLAVSPAGFPISRFDPQLHINGSVVYNGFIRGIAETVLLPDVRSGWLVLAGLVFYSRISAGACVVGSLLATLLAIFLGIDDTANIYLGLWSFAPALTAIALCGLFYALTFTTVVLSVLGVLFTVLLTVPLRMGGSVIGLPVFTFPFIFTTWLFLGAQGSIKHAPAVDLTEISTPERHLMDLWAEQKEKREKLQQQQLLNQYSLHLSQSGVALNEMPPPNSNS